MPPWERYQQTAPAAKPWERYQQVAPEPEPVVEPTPEPGFFDRATQAGSRFSEGMRKRGAHLADIMGADQTGAETAAQVGGHVLGTAGEVIAAPVGFGVQEGVRQLPEGGQEAIKKVGEAIAPLMQQYEENLEAYNLAYPRMGRNLQAVRELMNIVPLGAAPVRAAAKGAAVGSGKAVKSVAEDIVTAPVEGVATVAKGVKPLSEVAREEVSSTARAAAKKHYGAVKEAGAEFKPETISTLVKDIDAELAARGRLNPALHGKTIAILDDLKKDVEEGILDVSRLDENRKLLSRVKKGLEGAEDYGAAQAAVRVINKFEKRLKPDDFTKGTPEVMSKLLAGRAASHKAMKVEKISDILKQADGDPNRIKAGLTRFINKEKNLRGFTESEIKALRTAARSTTAEKLFKMAGKFGLDLGTSLTPGSTVAPILGGYIGGAPVIAAGTAARQLQKYMARGKADNVIRAIQKGKTPKELTKLPPKEVTAIKKAVIAEAE